ncbi:MAG: TraG/TraD/VirD4 family protein [Clostridiales bacterium]|nr:TraG/TraD/VirD4 family protein [Clostridiales bacterium]
MRREDISSGKDIKPILFLLDEAVQLNLDFSLLSQAMSTLRSKKVSIFLLVQSIAQIEGRYGEAHCREIMDLCAYISCFNAQDPKSRESFWELPI